MTKERARAKTTGLTRRNLLTALPISGAALALPANAYPETKASILAVIEELETVQGWEASNVSAARAYAAYRIREALGMDLPSEEQPQMHIDYQNQSYKDYQRTVWFERDQREGKIMPAPRTKL